MVSDKCVGTLVFVCLATLFVMGASGCSSNLYTSCKPDESSGCQKPTADHCISRPNFQCETRVCGKYDESDPFCTQACESDGDCPNGSCENFVHQKGQKTYCVPSDKS
ncbi:MAG: hypothetical protein ABEN55_13900 [Bradymonadaceae bacterium]